MLRIGALVAGMLAATWSFGLLPGAGQSPDLPYQEAYIAIGTTNTLLFVTSCWLLWPVIRRRTNWAATIAVLAVGLGPMLFWGESAKYHSLATFLVVLLFWLYDRPLTRWTLVAELHLFPEVNVPKLYENGRIIYDPDYGKCDRDPSPCPELPNYRGTQTTG